MRRVPAKINAEFRFSKEIKKADRRKERNSECSAL